MFVANSYGACFWEGRRYDQKIAIYRLLFQSFARVAEGAK